MIILRCWFEHLFKCAFEYTGFDNDDISEQQINILFDIIINGGRKLPQFYFKSNKCFKLSRLYDLIFEHITTSTNCSKMVPVILLEYISNSNFKLSKKAKNVEIKKLKVVKYTKYKISNIHNPKVKFSFCNAERVVHTNFGMNSNFKFKIRIMKV
uniref:Uncharacterized protein n=1 Tax=Meloidogyne enterolobii TaxID=390850 RepID=A0A6V7UCR3_MELEN|nr:unnamed protein product [Meloidogyne enterolobii]